MILRIVKLGRRVTCHIHPHMFYGVLFRMLSPMFLTPRVYISVYNIYILRGLGRSFLTLSVNYDFQVNVRSWEV